MGTCLHLSVAIPVNEIFEFVEDGNKDGSRQPLWKSSTNLFLDVDGVFEVGVGVGINALALPNVFICSKVDIAALPKTEKERVAKSKAPVD